MTSENDGIESENHDVDNDGKEDNKPSIQEIVINAITERTRELFIDSHGIPFAVVNINGHLETLPIKKSRFKRWIAKVHYELFCKPVRAEILNQITDLFETKALFDGNERDLQLRTCYHEESNILYVDLTNKTWQIIRISRDGWTVEESVDMPIMFTRYSNQTPQVMPSKTYSLDIFDQFMNLLNVKGDNNKLLLKCYMIALFIDGISKPVLILHGEQGSAKSSCHEIIKDVIDPSSIKTLSIPRDINELIQQLSHNFVAYYDNISYLRDWISDQFCRAVTGSGSSKRELYSDDDDVIYHFIRCIGLNGINIAATRADLLDRSVTVLLQRIDKKDRRNKKEILDELKNIKPRLLGYIFDILAKALGVIADGGIRLESNPGWQILNYMRKSFQDA